MRDYELVFILNPDLKEKGFKSGQLELEKLIMDLGGKVKEKDVWGLKDFAYPIRKFKQGFYVKFDIKLPEEKVSDWGKKVKLNEKIIRYLLIKKEVPDKKEISRRVHPPKIAHLGE